MMSEADMDDSAQEAVSAMRKARRGKNDKRKWGCPRALLRVQLGCCTCAWLLPFAFSRAHGVFLYVQGGVCEAAPYSCPLRCPLTLLLYTPPPLNHHLSFQPAVASHLQMAKKGSPSPYTSSARPPTGK
jgi:hypothetical protein